MKVLCACEESQAVTVQLRLRGHEAYSCDLQPASGGHPEWHLQKDVIPLLSAGWDAIIAFPPCTDLASSGARWFDEKVRDGRQQASIQFFMRFVYAPCDRIAIENPVGIMSTLFRKPSQIIQPYEFSHPERKATCLWLKGFPLLTPRNNVYDEMMQLPVSQRERVFYMSPGPERAKNRSKTYHGIATAMAEQWFPMVTQRP